MKCYHCNTALDPDQTVCFTCHALVLSKEALVTHVETALAADTPTRDPNVLSITRLRKDKAP